MFSVTCRSLARNWCRDSLSVNGIKPVKWYDFASDRDQHLDSTSLRDKYMGLLKKVSGTGFVRRAGSISAADWILHWPL